MLLIRYLLIGLIVYLIVRSIIRFGEVNEPDKSPKAQTGNGKKETKKVSKAIGEYVDYEEVKKKG